MSDRSRTEERERMPGVRALAPFHPEQVEDKVKGIGREEQGSSTGGSCLESTSEEDQELPGNHGLSVLVDLGGHCRDLLTGGRGALPGAGNANR